LATKDVPKSDTACSDVGSETPSVQQTLSADATVSVTPEALVDVECVKEGEIDIVEERSEHSVLTESESVEREGEDLEGGSASVTDTPASGHKAKLAFLGTEEVWVYN
ncbi:hypothetical protein KIPB_012377, partial [Kipferlia bialata]